MKIRYMSSDIQRLYRSIMKNLSTNMIARLNESNIDNIINDMFYGMLFKKINSDMPGIDSIIRNDRILAKIAGYVIEEQVKWSIEHILKTGNNQFTDGLDNLWDFKVGEVMVEVKAFHKGALYSNVKATMNQAMYKDKMTFILVEYKIENHDIKITGIAIVDGNELEFNPVTEKLIRNKNIKFRRPDEFGGDSETVI